MSTTSASSDDLGTEATATLDSVSVPTPGDYPYARFGALQRDRYIDSSEQALRELSAEILKPVNEIHYAERPE